MYIYILYVRSVHTYTYIRDIYCTQCSYIYIYNINTYIWDCIKIPCIFKCPKIMLSCFPSYRLLRLWALSNRNITFPAFCGCESILGRKSTNAISFHVPFIFLSCSFHLDFMLYSCPFMRLSFCIIFLLCSFHVLFTWHSCPLIFRRYV